MVGEEQQTAFLRAMETALVAAERAVARAQQGLDESVRRRDQVKKQVDELRADLRVPADDGDEPHEGSITEGARQFLKEKSQAADPRERAATVKEVETWLVRKGYRTHAKNFYHSVNGTLRAMADVVMLVHPQETTHFAWRETMVKGPTFATWKEGGWRLQEAPRRTTLASRYRQAPAVEPLKVKTKKGGK